MKQALAFVSLLLCFAAAAQKLPNIQQVSLRAPAGVKTDGKASEWGNRFQAYNGSINAWYTIANDDDKLYVIIHAEDPDVIHKMMRGCVTITINTSGKKIAKNAAVITFPDYAVANAPNVSLNNKPKPIADTAKLKMKNDSFMHLMNKRLDIKQKFIVVSGLTGITDSLISVYDDSGIKARVRLDSNVNYNYELAVPLKYLGISTGTRSRFSYNIRLNGISPTSSTVTTSVSGAMLLITDKNGNERGIQNNPRNNVMNYPTNFWGEYTLAKK